MNRSRWVGVIGLLFLVVLARCGGPVSPHDPVRIRIPAIGVDAPVQPLTVDPNGVLPPPDTTTAPDGGATAQNPANADPQ